MAKARAITKRRKAVRNIRKITQTMQLIATARFAKTLHRASAGKPYVEKLTEMVSAVSGGEATEHPLLTPNPSAKTSILLAITSNRGLAGSYNAGVLRTAIEHRRGLAAKGVTPVVEMVGKKGIGYFRFLQIAVSLGVTDIEDKITYARVAEMAEGYIRAYEAKQIARVDVAYMSFISVGQQKPVVAQLLPVEPPKVDPSAAHGASARRVEFEFSPSAEELLARLIPETVKIRLFQMFNEAIVSEQVARMVAMKAATDAAGDTIKSLTRQYNRARQSQITLELADIVGGAEAVK